MDAESYIEDLPEDDITDEPIDLASIDEIPLAEPDEQLNTENQEYEPFYYENDEPVAWVPDFELLGKNITSLSTGIDLPSKVFSLAVSFFNLSCGLFLTYESDSGFFSPFSSLSIDETTLRRCRINIEVLKDNDLIFGGHTIYTDVPKDFLKEYISKRIWDTIENLDLFIFSHHDKIFGLLIIINPKINKDPQYIDFASFFIRKSSELFFNSRSKIINSLPATLLTAPVDLPDVPGVVSGKISDFKEKDISSGKLIFIDYSNIISFILEKNNSIDRFRIDEDIYKMYNSMLFGSSFLIKIKEHRILLCLSSGINVNNTIIEHQMTSSLLSLFEGNDFINPPYANVISFECDNPELENDIHSLISNDR